MTIFDKLDITPRPDRSVVQHVKSFAGESEATLNDIEWLVQEKFDGLYCIILVQDDVTFYSKTGNEFKNLDNITSRKSFSHNGVFLAEVYNEGLGTHKLGGLIKSTRTKPLTEEEVVLLEDTEFHVFDILSIDEFKQGYSPRSYFQRYRTICRGLKVQSVVFKIETERLSFRDAEILRTEIVLREGEGIVLYNPDADWVAGRKNKCVLKQVPFVHLDLEATELIEGKGKFKGTLGKIMFKWSNDETIPIGLGKGWTDEERAKLWKEGLGKNKIFHIYAMKVSTNGKLRQPKVAEIRIDKFHSDI